MSQTSILQSTSREEAFPENVAGLFYVNTNCVICSMCDDLAPDVFRTSDDGDHNYVHSQPTTREQLELAEEALECCPVEAIAKEDSQASG